MAEVKWKNMEKTLSLLIILLGFVHSTESIAYLDPGPVSYYLQYIFGAAVTAIAVLRFNWYRIRNLFHKKDK